MNKDIIYATQNLLPLPLLLSLAVLSACAGDAPVDQRDEASDGEIAQALGCTPDQVAVCTDVNCEPDEFSCMEREDAKRLLRAGDHWHK